MNIVTGAAAFSVESASDNYGFSTATADFLTSPSMCGVYSMDDGGSRRRILFI